jgi:hypothetical protein
MPHRVTAQLFEVIASFNLFQHYTASITTYMGRGWLLKNVLIRLILAEIFG